MHVPSLCDIEVASGLRRAVARSWCPIERAEDALGDYADMPLTRHGHRSLLPRIFALRENFSAYDSAYVGLAEALGAALLTADGRLARAVGRGAAVPLA